MCMCKMGVITAEKYENLGIDVIKLKNCDLFWINSGDLRKTLYVTNMSYLILHQMKGYFDNKSPTKKQIQQLYCSLKELLKDKKYSSKSIYVRSDIAEKIIRNYSIKNQKNVYRREREKKVNNFLKNIGFKEDIVYLNKEDSIEEIIKTTCSGENISLQHSVLSYEIDIYFPQHELAIEIDELGHTDRDINKEIARQQE